MKNTWKYLVAFSCLMVSLNLISTAQTISLGTGPNFLSSNYPDWRSPGMGVSLTYEQRLFERLSVYVGGEVISVNEEIYRYNSFPCLGECPDKEVVTSSLIQIPTGLSFNLTPNRALQVYLLAGYSFSHPFSNRLKSIFEERDRIIIEKSKPSPLQVGVHSGSIGLELRRELTHRLDIGLKTTVHAGNASFSTYGRLMDYDFLFQSQIRLAYHLFPAKSRG